MMMPQWFGFVAFERSTQIKKNFRVLVVPSRVADTRTPHHL